MRQLTAKQKVLLTKIFNNNPTTVYSVDDLTAEEWQKVESINDTEILWQEVNRFLSDLFFDYKYKN